MGTRGHGGWGGAGGAGVLGDGDGGSKSAWQLCRVVFSVVVTVCLGTHLSTHQIGDSRVKTCMFLVLGRCRKDSQLLLAIQLCTGPTT